MGYAVGHYLFPRGGVLWKAFRQVSFGLELQPYWR